MKCALWPFRASVHPYTSSRMKNGSLEADFEEGGTNDDGRAAA
ncbi:hypothetical protein AB395_00002976 [Sinorhizobium fredii CCBAU 45436]|nr:hypothetical protein AB395_00002976 [Sinorhizobium fredii CCBAU 45436]